MFFGKEYLLSLKQHYPELIQGERQSKIDSELHIGFVDHWIRNFDTVGVDAPTRFQPLAARPWASDMSAWAVAGGGRNLRHLGAYSSYKGLINLKTAIDLVLYTNLIWELKPRTILEFGSLQGGSAVWFADQLDALCGHGEVHSFELCYKCISGRATHPRLQFHPADFRDLSTLARSLFQQFPHPWLVVDDAHENLSNLIPYVAGFMKSGDYFVIEDVFSFPVADTILGLVETCNRLQFLVDTKYTDAFGLNVTCSPNGWFVKQ
jgi:cephalosporin hydroxylase